MKKLLLLLLFILFVIAIISCTPVKKQAGQNTQTNQTVQASANTQNEDEFTKEFLFNQESAVKDTKSVSFGSSNGFELTANMVTGWNLGNTLDATGSGGMASELSWGQPLTAKEMIDGLAASGIKTIRIPISWHNHFIDKRTYTIHPEWMERVKTIVDWAIEDGMYVIINSHHDNYEKPSKMLKASGYYPNNTNLAESQRFLYNVWGQIATAFNNGYDEHLIFETMNEPRPAGTTCEWWYSGDSRCIEALECLLIMNQTALDAIRATGGNNSLRYVMCPSLQASENAASAPGFKMPVDIEQNTGANNRLILSVHAYTPYSFAMESPGERSFTEAHKTELNTMHSKLKRKFIDNGYPVVIGEYGATNKDNLSERLAWFEYFISSAKKNGIPCILWDNGVWQTRTTADGKPDYSEGYGYYNRTKQKWFFPEIIETITRASK